MKIISTNISTPKTISDGKREITTGIFKKPINEGIYLEKTDVKHDSVVDRRHHGGEDKACYLYSANHYPFWKNKYPNLDWNWGMFGENLTIEGLDESILKIGDTFEVGEAIIQISEPRIPCVVLGLRFGSKKMIKEFLNEPFCGTYVRVLQEGKVKKEDKFNLIETHCNSLTVKEVYSLYSNNKSNKQLLKLAQAEPFLSEKFKRGLR